MSLKIQLVEKRKSRWSSEEQIEFGKKYTDHMFIMDYSEKEGWHNPTIQPYQNISLDPASLVFHYGQELFEGLKAYRDKDGGINLFRPEENFKRMNRSCERIAIPKINEKKLLEYLIELIRIEKDWVPKNQGKALYIRPFIISTQAELGIKSSNEYKFMIILTPTGSYYSHDLSPVDIYVETKYVRASLGGTGEAKVGGNYAGTLMAQKEAYKKGYAQVLWLDAVKREFVEEAGSMNIFFVIDDLILTPRLSGTILPGITRMSMIEFLTSEGYKVEEEDISINELANASKEGRLKEMFGTGTAAVITPIKKLRWKNIDITTSAETTGEIAKKCFFALNDLHHGEIKDKFNWIVKIS